MDNIPEYVDERHKGWCIYCGTEVATVSTNRDHVPSKTLLLRPLPRNLPVIASCTSCNSRFAPDEEYLFLFLSCVLSGSTNPDDHSSQRAAKALRHHKKLRARIERSKTEYQTIGGDTRQIWNPEEDRINRVITKNARGHYFFEYGEPIFAKPDYVWTKPLESMTGPERNDFEDMQFSGTIAAWPEVGSRMLQRVMTGQDLRNGWVIVQDKVYRYGLRPGKRTMIRCVLFEYLATEVCWSNY